MPTSRNLNRLAFQCGRYEAQDVIVASDDVDLVPLEPGRGFRFKERWQRRLLFKDVSCKLALANPGIHKVRLTKEYELFVVVCQTYWDLLHANAVEGWKDYCRTSVCWLDELYAARLDAYKYWLPLLAEFDHVIVGMNGTIQDLGKAISKPCHYVPGAVDAIRFSPYPHPPPRVIDVYSIGRRWDGIHGTLQQLTAGNRLFYIYDSSAQGGEVSVSEPSQHRELYASVAKRSRYFIVAPGKVNVFDETQGQIEVGYRYYEGAAAGTVMVGQAPNCEPFRRMFDWRDAVIEIQPDGSDVARVLAELDEQPERLHEIRRRNSREALLRHDWVYRWNDVLDIAGLRPGQAMQERVKRLKDLAELAESDG
jgi:hypothetical protein